MAGLGCIYLITNTSNKKCYVGQTTKSAEHRWKQHIKCSKYSEYSHYALYRAFNKYGVDKFTFEVIVSNVPIELLNDLETNCITAYDGMLGYNMVPIGNSMKGYKFTEEVLTHLSNVRKGRVPVNKGKKFPERSGRNHPRAKEVICLTTGVVYESALAAANDLQLQHSSVVAVCNGRRGTTKGFMFKYTSSTKENRVFTTKGGANINAKKIICVTTGVEYASISEAAEAMNLKAGSISRVCKQQRNSLFGYVFKYKDK